MSEELKARVLFPWHGRLMMKLGSWLFFRGLRTIRVDTP